MRDTVFKQRDSELFYHNLNTGAWGYKRTKNAWATERQILLKIYLVSHLFDHSCNSHLLTLFRKGLFEKAPFPTICHIYPTIVKFGTVIPNRKKIQKMYKLRDTPLEFFSWRQHFSTGNQQLYRLYFNT